MKSERELQKNINFNIDSLLSLHEAPQYVATENNSDHFLVYQKNNEMTKIDLYLSKVTRLIERLDYSYRTVQYVKGKMFPSGVYKTFRLVN